MFLKILSFLWCLQNWIIKAIGSPAGPWVGWWGVSEPGVRQLVPRSNNLNTGSWKRTNCILKSKSILLYLMLPITLSDFGILHSLTGIAFIFTEDCWAALVPFSLLILSLSRWILRGILYCYASSELTLHFPFSLSSASAFSIYGLKTLWKPMWRMGCAAWSLGCLARGSREYYC